MRGEVYHPHIDSQTSVILSTPPKPVHSSCPSTSTTVPENEPSTCTHSIAPESTTEALFSRSKPQCVGMSAQDIQPFPKVGSQKRPAGRQRTKNRILTNMPVKESITAEYEER